MKLNKLFLVERSLELRVRTLALLSTLLLSTLNSIASQQLINVGTTANDHTGDPNRAAWIKANGNFTELYNFYLGLPVYQATNEFLGLNSSGVLLPAFTNFWTVNAATFDAWFAANVANGSSLTNLNATNLSGTLQGAQFPVSLPAIGGAALTGVTDASALHSANNLGEIPNPATARSNLSAAFISGATNQNFNANTNTAAYFIGSGAGLTNLPGGSGGGVNVIAGSGITTVTNNGTNVTVNVGGTLPAANATALTNLNAASLAVGGVLLRRSTPST